MAALQFDTSKFLRNQEKVEDAFSRKLDKRAFEVLAARVAQQSVYKGVDAQFSDRYAFVAKVDGVWAKLVVLRKPVDGHVQGVTLFAFNDQSDAYAKRHAANKLA